jgi:hypothetical protein
MKGKLKYYIIVMLLSIFCLSLYAQMKPKETPAIEPRTPTEEQIKTFTKQKDFNYKSQEEVMNTWLDRLLGWIEEKMFDLFSDKPSAALVRYLIIAALAVFIILTLLKVKPQWLFFKNKEKPVAGFEFEEAELLQSNLDELAEKEIKNRNYRAAIRYLFLKLLKQLDEKEIIRLGIQKTNRDYLYEAGNSSCSSDFRKLSIMYEFTWYGKFRIEETLFEKVYKDFKNIFAKLDA